MSERKLGAAIHGAGWVSGEHLKAYVRNPHCEVVAISSRREESCRQRAIEAGLDPDQLAVYTSYDDLLADPRVDVLSICTPTDLHVEEGIKAAQAGKHFIIEKAIALDLEGLKALRDAVREAGVKTVVGFVLRLNPSLLNMRRLLDQQAIGKLFYAEADYWHGVSDWYSGWEWARTKRAGGSSFLFAGCHAVDALRWMVGAEATEVAAFSGGWDDRYEYAPTEVAIVKFDNGVIGKLSSSLDCVMPYAFNLDLLGDKGTLRDNRIWAPELFPGQNDWTEVPCILPDSGDVEHHPFEGEIDHFVECVLGDQESYVNVEDAVRTHELCIAMDLSAERGGELVQLPLLD
ncbi:MAG: Gfo/Idh/MocA family oxidoreductase [Armatimonadetes bacterium]|nr:Gfo/Idh/MocA family oxidoreductase [Armatimonadota bacterium]